MSRLGFGRKGRVQTTLPRWGSSWSSPLSGTPVYMTFINFEKAFDNIDRSVAETITSLGHPWEVHPPFTEDLWQLQLQSHQQWSPFRTDRDAHWIMPGCLLLPFLFLLSSTGQWQRQKNIAMTYSEPSWLWLEDLDCADDVALLSHNHQGMQSILDKLTHMAKISAKAGLRINKSKAKGMRINTTNADRPELDGKEMDEVEDIAYLGSNKGKNGGSDQGIHHWIGKVRTAFWVRYGNLKRYPERWKYGCLTPTWNPSSCMGKSRVFKFSQRLAQVTGTLSG